jgi:hypothetical protein
MRNSRVAGRAALGPRTGFEQDHQRQEACGRRLAAVKPMIQRPRFYPEYPGKIFEAQVVGPHEAAQALRQAVAFPSGVSRVCAQ